MSAVSLARLTWIFVRVGNLTFGGGSPTMAALYSELVTARRWLDAQQYGLIYALARITPGTNLLALYAALGHRLGGWPLAVQAVAVGALVPAVIVVVIAFFYTEHNSPIVAALMKGARAAGVAVFLGAAVRLLKPQLRSYGGIAMVLAAAVFLAAWFLAVSPFVVLLLAGASGALWLRPVS